MEALPEGPALKPPPGVIPDFANPGGHHGIGYGVVILCSILAKTAVALRLYARDTIKDLKLEDGLLVSALGSSQDISISCTTVPYLRELKSIGGTFS
ncbi:hypothetical protein EPUS_07144 [Endocarpon pusillum Z07020]|uniref:Uncharacterized protein n=1 Tax=Endocarpon pusillum (strain Z07020 / HMAS-L-300199) TaxID=1263415 RepID=U1GAL9_ENDPU|nr:uncharacterized protein EPUS_07144 [Endocarpon pusillum Z07020]ERF68726.1 hypothetical protein EPUS_07144 [Endocarpon pusillum Z07020]